MGFFTFLKSKTFLINLGFAIVIIAGIAWAVLKYLDIYTLHGETITVPDLKGLSVSETEEMLEGKGLKYEIMDSVYETKTSKGVVLDQEPKANSLVKENRIIYLTINATLPPKFKMPNLKDLSLRQATAVIETYGLKVGNLRYVPDLAFNAVVDQEYKGRALAPGSLVSKGSVIDLVLGQGESDELIAMPYLINLTSKEAIELLKQSFLNVSIIPDNSVKDTSLARVYRQNPPFDKEKGINLGGQVDIFITEDFNKINVDTISKGINE